MKCLQNGNCVAPADTCDQNGNCQAGAKYAGEGREADKDRRGLCGVPGGGDVV